MKRLVEKIDRFFIHEKLQAQIEEFGRARILLYALFITTFFSSSYSIYYELTNDDIHIVKHFANLGGLLTGPIGILLLKYKSDLRVSLFVLLVIAITLVFTSTFFSGGIFSVDSMWMVVIPMVCFLFVGNRGGIAIASLAILFFTLFYVFEKLELRDFLQDSINLGIGYKLYNLCFLLAVASFITYFFVSGAEKIKRELDELKERQVKSLDYKYRYITDNAKEIIGLHTIEGETTYLSPAIKTILGYEPEEMLGMRYKHFLGGKMINKEILCLNKNGKEVWLDISYQPIKEQINNGEMYISMARDISDKVLENKKMSQLRQQIANDFHDEMGNKLASITLTSTILGLRVTENPELTDMISKIEDTSKSLYQHSRDFIWSIDSKSDELREIFAYIRDFGEDFLHTLQINFLVEGEGFSEQRKIILPMYWGRHIILIFKEVLTNTAKHSRCKNVVLSLQIKEEHYIISIKDDGVGIPAIVKTGKGLQSIKDRAKNIDCDLQIESNNFGTVISLIGKLPRLGEGVL